MLLGEAWFFRGLQQPNPSLEVRLCSLLCFLGSSSNLGKVFRPREAEVMGDDNLHLNQLANAGRDHVQPGCGCSGCCFSPCWQFTWHKGSFSVVQNNCESCDERKY